MKSHEDHGHDLNVKKIDRLSSTRVRLTMEYSGETVKRHEQMTANRYLNMARIPGFRPGKAPVKMVTEKYKEEILKDVISHLVEHGLQEAFEKTKLMPVNQPRLQVNPRQLGNVEPFEFQAEFEVEPEIELRNYKGVPLKASDLEVNEDEVTKTIDNIREQMASLEPVEREKAEKGDFALIEIGYELTGEPKKSQPAKQFTVELGVGRLLPELETALLEMPVGGEPRKITAKFPDDYDDDEVKGREAIFDTKVLELKKKVLPEMTDELAGQIRQGSTVESLKKDIRENIASSKKQDDQRSQREQIVEYLVANHTFEVPASLVERQMHSMLQWMAQDLARRGQKPSPLGQEEIDMLKKRAEQMVRSSLLLKEIATKEKIQADEKRVAERVADMAKGLGKSAEETEKLISERGMLDRLRDEVLTDQVFEFLVNNAERVGSAPRP